MDQNIHSFLESCKLDLHIRFEVQSLIRDLIDTIGCYEKYNETQYCEEKLKISQGLNDALIQQVTYLQHCCTLQAETVEFVKSQARSMRHNFVSDVGNYLADRQSIQKLEDKIVQLQELSINQSAGIEGRLSNNHEIRVEKSYSVQHQRPTTKVMPRILLELDDTPLLYIFSFLSTEEVLNYAQVCRFVYRRIDAIFDIQSSIVKEEWGVISDPPVSVKEQKSSNNVQPAVSPADFDQSSSNNMEPKLSREMIEVLTKRLSGWCVLVVFIWLCL